MAWVSHPRHGMRETASRTGALKVGTDIIVGVEQADSSRHVQRPAKPIRRVSPLADRRS